MQVAATATDLASQGCRASKQLPCRHPRASPAAQQRRAVWPRAVPPPRPPRARRLAAPVASGSAAAAAEPAAGVSAFEELAASTGPQYIMISGKGGVGKTSLAAAWACGPAHPGRVHRPRALTGRQPRAGAGRRRAVRVDGAPNSALWGLEIDPEREKARFKAYAAASGRADFAEALGGLPGLGALLDQLADLKLGELLDTPPPGFDEAVAIAKVQELVTRSEEPWDRIVFDTAPTGHTLRLLTVPDFVEASLAKITRLRRKLAGANAAVRGLFGAGGEQEGAVDKLESLQASIRMVKDLFHNQKETEFVIATIPTVLGLSESARLVRALRRERIPCKRIVVNQLLTPSMGEKYLEMKEKDQARALALIDSDPELAGLRKLTVPYLDRETRGVPALQYFGQLLWGPVLEEFAAGAQRRYYMLGGKGGVGKTTAAASLGLALGGAAPAGGAALVISTDPAHSLGDALDQDISGGRPVEVAGTDGRVWALELDIEQAREELRSLSGKDDGAAIDRVLSSVGLGAIASQLQDLRLGELMDTPPPGIDEIIAIAKVIQLLKDPAFSRFSRVVFDTAPTGHTLRLLALPDFLDTSVGKILSLQQKLASVASSIKQKVTSLVPGASAEEEPPSSLDNFKDSLAEVQRIFRDPSATSFVVVCIATAMAAAESSRLVRTLRREHVPVQAMVLNQVLQPHTSATFLEQRLRDQRRALELLAADPELAALQRIEAPLLELEVRGLPALQYFGRLVWSD